jgi:hypothetical protein
MSDRRLTRPDYLRRRPRLRLSGRPAGAIALVLGVVAFVAVAVVQPSLWATPEWRIGAPGLGATAVAAVVSIARREPGASPLWLAGLGLAATALVIGWFLMLAIAVAATVAVILILHAVM